MSNAIDLNRLPPPMVIDTIDVEHELATLRADLLAKDPDLATVLALESEPLTKLLQAAALRISLLRQQFNDRAWGLLLAYASGPDLDHIGVTYYHTPRLVLDQGNPNAVPPVPASYETDDDYRQRLLLSQDGYSVAGPEAAYVYHATSADADVKDIRIVVPRFERLTLTPEQEAALPPGAQVYVTLDDAGLNEPTPATVAITVLSREGDGSASPELLATIDERLGDDVRPITDEVFVRSATIMPYTICAELTLYPGFNEQYIRQVAEESLAAWVDTQHRIGRDITTAGIKAALMVEGVHDILLIDRENGTDLTVTLIIEDTEAAYCTGLQITVGGYDA